MALEKTVLTEASTADILKDSYAIQAVSVEKIRLGSANCRRVSDESRCYFLKEFQSGFPKDNLIREAELAVFLSESGIPVARFIPTVSGEPFVSFRGHLICLEEYLDGITYGYGDFPKPCWVRRHGCWGKSTASFAITRYPRTWEKRGLPPARRRR